MKDKYEISLWEDYLVEASGNVPAHYEERKLCVIGSDTMTASFRAYAPQLKSDINGTHTLTFKMYYTIKENEITVENSSFSIDGEGNFVVNGHTSDEVRTPTYSTFNLEKTKNPFLNLLINERKVKCFWKGEWYDFVIKNCAEDSSGKSITYTCTDLFINELSKNGFNSGYCFRKFLDTQGFIFLSSFKPKFLIIIWVTIVRNLTASNSASSFDLLLLQAGTDIYSPSNLHLLSILYRVGPAFARPD